MKVADVFLNFAADAIMVATAAGKALAQKNGMAQAGANAIITTCPFRAILWALIANCRYVKIRTAKVAFGFVGLSWGYLTRSILAPLLESTNMRRVIRAFIRTASAPPNTGSIGAGQ